LHDANCFAASQTPGSFNEQGRGAVQIGDQRALIDPGGRPSVETAMAALALVGYY
jgi:hypothetical protein